MLGIAGAVGAGLLVAVAVSRADSRETRALGRQPVRPTVGPTSAAPQLLVAPRPGTDPLLFTGATTFTGDPAAHTFDYGFALANQGLRQVRVLTVGLAEPGLALQRAEVGSAGHRQLAVGGRLAAPVLLPAGGQVPVVLRIRYDCAAIRVRPAPLLVRAVIGGVTQALRVPLGDSTVVGFGGVPLRDPDGRPVVLPWQVTQTGAVCPH